MSLVGTDFCIIAHSSDARQSPKNAGDACWRCNYVSIGNSYRRSRGTVTLGAGIHSVVVGAPFRRYGTVAHCSRTGLGADSTIVCTANGSLHLDVIAAVGVT